MSAPATRSGVTVTPDAMRSARFGTLARVCGLADEDHARGKMLRLWDQCLEEQTYVLPIDDVVSVLGEQAIDGLARARLGELVEGGVRIRGTEGRIEWKGELRGKAAAAGTKRAAGAPRDARGRLLPSDHQRQSSGSPAVTSRSDVGAAAELPARDGHAGTSSASSVSPAPAGDAGLATSSGGPAESSPPTPIPSPIPESLPPARDPTGTTPPPGINRELAELEQHAISRLNEIRAAIDPDAPRIPAMAGQPGTDLRELLRLVGGNRRKTLDDAIDVMAATGTSEGWPVGEYRLGMLAGPKSWHRWTAGTVAGAARGRAPPGRAGQSGRPRALGQFTPDPTTKHPDGDQPL